MLAAVPIGTNKKLAYLEIKNIAERRGEKSKYNGIIRIESDDLKFYSARVSYSKIVGRYWGSFRKSVASFVRETGLAKYTLENSPFYVKTYPGGFERKFGWWLEGFVNAKTPKTKVVFVRIGKRWHVIAPAVEIRGKDFAKRDSKNRPFFHPASMNAREARLVVNLTGVQKGEKFLDPFCGAGGILIEAGIVGAEVFGTDIDEKMVNGCTKNLEYYGIKGIVERKDARTVKGKFDAIGTDLPYGRSSKLSENVKKLYKDAIETMLDNIKRRRFFVFVAPFDCRYIVDDYGCIVERKYVHSSLTRWYHICRA